MALSRIDILSAAANVPIKEVAVPEWGDGATIRLRCLTSKGRLEWGLASQKAVDGQPGPEPNALLIVLAAVDDNGKPLFQIQDSDALADMRGDVIGRLAEQVREMSGLTDAAVADAEGNSDATLSGATQSDSPEPSVAP